MADGVNSIMLNQRDLEGMFPKAFSGKLGMAVGDWQRDVFREHGAGGNLDGELERLQQGQEGYAAVARMFALSQDFFEPVEPRDVELQSSAEGPVPAPKEGPSAGYRERLKRVGATALLGKIKQEEEVQALQRHVVESGLRFYDKKNVVAYLVAEARKVTELLPERRAASTEQIDVKALAGNQVRGADELAFITTGIGGKGTEHGDNTKKKNSGNGRRASR